MKLNVFAKITCSPDKCKHPYFIHTVLHIKLILGQRGEEINLCHIVLNVFVLLTF